MKEGGLVDDNPRGERKGKEEKERGAHLVQEIADRRGHRVPTLWKRVKLFRIMVG